MKKISQQRGLTLLELAVVVAILVVLVSVVLLKTDHTQDRAADIATRATLKTLRDAFVGSSTGPGYLDDVRFLPGFDLGSIRIADLLASPTEVPLYDIVTHRGWHGPYLENVAGVRNLNAQRHGQFPAAEERRFTGDETFLERGFYDPPPATGPYGIAGDPAVADAWGNPIVLQIPDGASGDSPATRLLNARLVSAGPDGKLETLRNAPEAQGDDLVLFLQRANVYENP